MTEEGGEIYVDFGAGSAAEVARLLAQSNPTARVIAIEKGGFFRRPVETNLAGVTAEFSNDSSLPLKDSSVDRVFATFVWGEMSGKEGYAKLIREFARVLKKGGLAFLCETSRNAGIIIELAENAGLKLKDRVTGSYPPGSEWGKLASESGNIMQIPTVLIFTN